MTVVFRSICWILAAYFFVIANLLWGWPPEWTSQAAFSIGLSIFLFLLPFAKSISLGSWFSFEAKIEGIKDDVDAFKAETRNILAMQSLMITNVSQNVAQHTTFNLPSLSDAYTAERRIEENSPTVAPTENADRNVSEYIAQSRSDPNLALAKLRMELEIEFRRILGKRTKLGAKTDVKFMSLRSLWQEFFKYFKEKRYLLEALQYVNDICNAAVHGQQVPSEHAVEALSMGFRILEELRDIDSQ